MEELIEFLTEKATGEAMSIVNLKNGAAIEMFDIELEKALANIADINTAAGDREVKLIVKLVPSVDKGAVGVKISVPPAKLVGGDIQEAQALIAYDSRGRVIAKEHRPIQKQLPMNIKKMRGAEND